MKPLVSILLPCYNGRQFLGVAIQSLLRQTWRDLEILVIDDGSTDGSVELANDFSKLDERVRCIRTPHQGLPFALNVGLSNAHGEFIARMDADDICLQDRIARQVDFLSMHPRVLAVGAWAIYICPQGLPLYTQSTFVTHDEIVVELKKGHGSAIIHPTLLARRQALHEIGGYREKMTYSEDFDLYLRLAEYGELANIPQPLLLYRQHLGSVCHSARSAQGEYVGIAMEDALQRNPNLWQGFKKGRVAAFSTPVGALVEWARIAVVRRRRDLATEYCREAIKRKPLSRSVISLVHDLITDSTNAKRRCDLVESRLYAFGKQLSRDQVIEASTVFAEVAREYEGRAKESILCT